MIYYLGMFTVQLREARTHSFTSMYYKHCSPSQSCTYHAPRTTHHASRINRQRRDDMVDTDIDIDIDIDINIDIGINIDTDIESLSQPSRRP